MNSVDGAPRARVLVVDDDQLMREILCDFLAPAGYAIESAGDGAEAWEILNRSPHPFDVLVTDRDMPRMNGMELLAKVKSDARFNRMPVIFQTSMSAVEEIAEGINAGVYYYLTKPYEQKVLLALVDTAIGELRRYRELGDQTKRYVHSLRLLDSGEFRFRTLQEVYEMTSLLAFLSCHREKVVAGLSELLLNAVEHGNLGITYAEKSELVTEGLWQQEIERRQQTPEFRDLFVTVQLTRAPERTTFRIIDQGKGFDPAKYLNFDPERATDVHGRGIAMSRLMSFSTVEYQGCGNEVVAVAETAPAA